MLDLLNCCSYGRNIPEPNAKIVRVKNVPYKAPTPSISYVALPNLQENEKEYNSKSFVLEWLQAPLKDIDEEIKNLEKRIERRGENFLIFKQQKELLEDIKIFIFNQDSDDYKPASIRLELATLTTASKLHEISKTPTIKEYNFTP